MHKQIRRQPVARKLNDPNSVGRYVVKLYLATFCKGRTPGKVRLALYHISNLLNVFHPLHSKKIVRQPMLRRAKVEVSHQTPSHHIWLGMGRANHTPMGEPFPRHLVSRPDGLADCKTRFMASINSLSAADLCKMTRLIQSTEDSNAKI